VRFFPRAKRKFVLPNNKENFMHSREERGSGEEKTCEHCFIKIGHNLDLFCMVGLVRKMLWISTFNSYLIPDFWIFGVFGCEMCVISGMRRLYMSDDERWVLTDLAPSAKFI
jgi:hypothetical protein